MRKILIAALIASAASFAFAAPASASEPPPHLWTAHQIGEHHDCWVNMFTSPRRYRATCGHLYRRVFRPCPHRWSHGCMWDAPRRHATGRSFIDIGGRNFYLRPTRVPIPLP